MNLAGLNWTVPGHCWFCYRAKCILGRVHTYVTLTTSCRLLFCSWADIYFCSVTFIMMYADIRLTSQSRTPKFFPTCLQGPSLLTFPNRQPMCGEHIAVISSRWVLHISCCKIISSVYKMYLNCFGNYLNYFVSILPKSSSYSSSYYYSAFPLCACVLTWMFTDSQHSPE